MWQALITRRRRLRRRTGTILPEFVGALVVLALVTLMAVNMGLTLFAAWTNDAACRDAVRAAAQQTNATSAQTAASVALSQFKSGSSWFSGPTLLTSGTSFDWETFKDPTTGIINWAQVPFCRVTTRMIVTMPAPIIFVNARMTDQITLTQSYAFPLTNPNIQ